MNRTTTLSEFIIDRQKDFPFATGELTSLLSAIELASKIIHREVNRAGLGNDILGAAGEVNVQGEDQQKLDLYANEQFIHSLANHQMVCGIASEEDDYYLDENAGLNPDGKYIVTMDPLDGSSNIDVNVSIGTIFSIYRRLTEPGSPVEEKDFLQPGKNQVAAGYVLYGSSTQLVYSTGNGVNVFTLDPTLGVFCLTHSKVVAPDSGKIYSINEGNYFDMEEGLKNYINFCKSGETKKPYTARYIGSLVADFHRNLLKGGIYIYPGTSKTPKGKLRLLYEANPLAFIIEQAGGLASDGKTSIMELVPTELHQRTPLVIGSKHMVNQALEFLN